MKRIGITGGVGAGKSFVCALLEEKGFPVFYSDEEAKKIMVEDTLLIQQITELFGEEAYINGELNRPFIASVIFTQPEKRERLNALVHPAVYRAFDKWCALQTTPLAFIESALMIDTGNHTQLNAIILVVADEKTRIKRVIKRDATHQEAVENRINAQTSDDFKRQYADFIIDNSEGRNVVEQLEVILKAIV